MLKNIEDINLVVMGGGTGSFTLLQSMKELTPNITAIVNMSDDGGSTGVLRDELGVLPPGDVRQCLVALSDVSEVRDLFNYRFSDGSFYGHSLGNIVLSGLELQKGSFDQAVKVASRILHITGKVVPASLDKHTLVLEDGLEIIKGEYTIGNRSFNNSSAKISLEPNAEINPEAKESINDADLIIIAPGNLFGSIIPIFAVNGIKQALNKSKAKIVSVMNLVNKPGQTDNWHVVDYVKELEKYIGKDEIDYVLYNNHSIKLELLEKYAVEGEFPVSCNDSRFREIHAEAIGANLVAQEIIKQDPNDRIIRRTLIRHNSIAVNQQLVNIINNSSTV